MNRYDKNWKPKSGFVMFRAFKRKWVSYLYSVLVAFAAGFHLIKLIIFFGSFRLQGHLLMLNCKILVKKKIMDLSINIFI